jgi:hypothetical protein
VQRSPGVVISDIKIRTTNMKKLDKFQVSVLRSQMDWGHVIAIHGICICAVIEKKSSSV